MQVLGVIGWSGSGKTSLLEYLVRELSQQGWRIHVIKHSHHDVHTEPPGKDSARLRMAGAVETMLVSPYRTMLTRELRNEAEPDLMSLLARLSPADLVLIEGYKWADIPKLEVYRPSLGRSALYAQDAHVLAIATDSAQTGLGKADLTWLDLNQPVKVLNWLIDALQHKKFELNLTLP